MPLGAVGLLRWMWRQLTSMRTALVLLFLLALASIPGSVLPQRGTNPLRAKQWLANNPALGPVLDRLGFFDVYSSPWFAAVYLLLFVSLIGCVLPRSRQHWKAMRSPPPPAPRRLDRLPVCVEVETDLDPGDVLLRARQTLRTKRWRLRESQADETSRWIAAEKGVLRESGNLIFHLSLVFLLAGVAIGGLFGWKGNVIIKEGEGFSDTLTQFDAWGGGRFVNPEMLTPFSFTLNRFQVDFERGEAQRGAPRMFAADVTSRSVPDASSETTTIGVNEPLDFDGTKVYLVGHGYAPRFVITDSTGAAVFDDDVVFLPQDGNMTSTGVVKVPDSSPPLGISGVFLPTAGFDSTRGPFSSFPAPDDPRLLLSIFTGDLGLDSGVPSSVFTLDTSKLTKIDLAALRVGETRTLPNGAGTITFTGFDRWASFQIAYDPGKELVLAAAVAAIAGLLISLFIRRRRIWVKVVPGAGGGSRVQVAGLAKTEASNLPEEVADLASRLGTATATKDQEKQL